MLVSLNTTLYVFVQRACTLIDWLVSYEGDSKTEIRMNF